MHACNFLSKDQHMSFVASQSSSYINTVYRYFCCCCCFSYFTWLAWSWCTSLSLSLCVSVCLPVCHNVYSQLIILFSSSFLPTFLPFVFYLSLCLAKSLNSKQHITQHTHTRTHTLASIWFDWNLNANSTSSYKITCAVDDRSTRSSMAVSV